MTAGPHAALLEDGKRLHLQHGPIDLIIEAFGSRDKISRAYKLATSRFQTILEELVEELPLLRTPVSDSSNQLKGNVARKMHQAILPYAPRFITPMAAVAGSVADEILNTMRQETGLQKIYVNNGGDIAIYLDPECQQDFTIGIISDPRTGKPITKARIKAGSSIFGIATSGWHGRSHSLGIADSVTVFAKSAAAADAGATLIANAVNLPDCIEISRSPASELSPDSDLFDQLVTTKVGALTSQEISAALDAGENTANTFLNDNLIEAAFISLKQQERIIGRSQQKPDNFQPKLSTPKQADRIAYA